MHSSALTRPCRGGYVSEVFRSDRAASESVGFQPARRWRNWAPYHEGKPRSCADEIITYVNTTAFPAPKELAITGNSAAKVAREVHLRTSDCYDTDDGALLRVDTYAGQRGESEPRRPHFRQRAVTVTEVIDRWLDLQPGSMACLEQDVEGQWVLAWMIRPELLAPA